MDDAGTGRWTTRTIALMAGYGGGSLTLTGLYPFLPGVWAKIVLLIVSIGAMACVGYGWRVTPPGARRPWTLLFWALAAFVAVNLVLLVPDGRAAAARWLLAAAGNLLILAAALTVIRRHRDGDLGGVVDATVIALAAGTLLWAVLPHQLGQDQSLPARLNLFVVVFALTGVLGALLRFAHTVREAGRALWWLSPAIGLSITGNVILSLAGNAPVLESVATMLFMAASTAAGLFGLDPTGLRLAYAHSSPRDRLSTSRLVFLAVAVALIPGLIGTRELLAGDTGGVLLAVQGTLVAVLVMVRVGLLSAQRARAERALEREATHDPLTHLLNRREFMIRLNNRIDRNARVAVLFCDLDGFKSVNDEFGHAVGDALLVEVAHRLRTCVGPPHLVSRFGGDEFVVLIIDASADEVQATQECITTALRRPFPPAGAAEIHASIGQAFATQERDPERLIRSADHAMYRVKASRRGRPARAVRAPRPA